MEHLNRRQFVKTAAGMAGALGIDAASTLPLSGSSAQYDASQDMLLGTIAGIRESADKSLSRIREFGFTCCQISVTDYSPESAHQVKEALVKYDLKPVSLICMGPGQYAWNFYEGPITIGFVPRGWRRERIARFKVGADFCIRAGIPAVHAHFGFIPENPNDELYEEFITAMQEVAHYTKERGLDIYMETGQETPVALLRAIIDIGTDNIFINYDTANLILYGKANPVDGLDVIGKYVKSLHAKDGLYPTDPKELGKEVPIGEGKVDFPRVFRRLKELNFKGFIVIEREISGPKQAEDIAKSKAFLENLIKNA